MALTLSLVFLIVAAILFLIAAAGIAAGRVSVLALGLVFFALAEIARG